MKAKRILALALCAAVALAFLAACSGDETGHTEAAELEETAEPPPAVVLPPVEIEVVAPPPQESLGDIGFSVYDMYYGFFQSMERGVRERAEELGYGFILHDQRSSEAEMVAGAISLIDQGVVALIISPCKPSALPAIVEAAKGAGIPVIVSDIGGGGADFDAIVISDCFAGGYIAAGHALDLLAGGDGSGKAAIIRSESEALFALRRGDGFSARMTDAGFAVVAEVTGHSQRAQGYSIMLGLLDSHPDLAVVFAENDPMAVGAANALVDAGRDDVIVIGFNNDLEAQDAIRSGVLAGTIAQFPDQIGAISADLADTLLNGGTIQFDDPDLREVFAPVALITAMNLD